MADRKVFHDSVTTLPTQLGLTSHGLFLQATKAEHRAERMPLTFSLALPAAAKASLEKAVASGKTISPSELRTLAPKQADLDALANWLKGQGFGSVITSKDHTSIYADAPVGQVEKALQVHMMRVTKDGLTYTAAQNAPSLPSDVGGPVQAILGLQPFRLAHKHSKFRSPRKGNRLGLGKSNGPSTGPSTNVENAPPYLVAEVMRAYGASGLPVTGKGQTIGILIDTFPSMDDVQTFWTKNGIAMTPARVSNVNVSGSALPAPSGEETLDVEWSSGIASGATIKVYTSGTLAFADLDRALDQILADATTDPTMRQVSISLGLGETYFGAGEITAQHQKFLQLAALGVNVFVSSGDAGSNPDQTGHGSDGPLQVEYESSDPCVVSVGGTSLTLAADGTVATEVGWTSGGGGKSASFTRPPWQTGPGVPSGKARLVPDVSLIADPDEGAMVVFQGQVLQYGGTSLSAPAWAGFCALINEARVKAGAPTLPFLNPLIYPLAATGFRDVTDGSNGAYEATAGYDMVTGLGVPNLSALIQALTS
jgi:kumamolisin